MISSSNLRPAVVLVADRTLSADYKILFEGIFATMQTTKVPELVMRNFVSPPARVDQFGRAKTVPLGLRRVESALLKYTDLGTADVVCTTPEALDKLMGPWVKVVGISSSDPLGNGMSNTTTTQFWKGQLYTRYWTRQMLEQIARAKDKYGFKIVAGGAGAWQWQQYGDDFTRDVIDVIFEGYFESQGPAVISDIVNDLGTLNHVIETDTAFENIQKIDGASLLGIVELSRGCGRGCKFCTMAKKKAAHLSADMIISDLQTNVDNGIGSVVSGSEDFFRYGSDTLKPDFDKLCGLLDQMKKIKGLSFMQIDHANITSVLQLTDHQLREIRELLSWDIPTDYMWVNMGVESANGHLVANSCPGKISPYKPDDWDQMVRETADKMTRTGYFSVFSLVLGLPGETEKDIERTIDLVKFLEKQNAVVFPVFYEPLPGDDNRFTMQDMTLKHLELYSRSYEINFKKVAMLYWDNQRAGGVSLLKRSMIRMLGKVETTSWRSAFKKLRRQLENSNGHKNEV